MGVENDLLPAKRPEVDSSTTKLPDDHNKHLATRRILQVEGQFESPTSRRSFLRMLGLVTVGVTTGGVAYALLPRNDASAASAPSIPKPLETNKEPRNLTASEVFGNNVTTEQELRNNPDEVFDYQLVTNAQEIVKKIVVLSYKDNGVDEAVTVMNLNSQGKYDKGYQITNSIPINPESVYVSDQRLLIGGETKPGIWIPALLESRDDGKTFTVKKLPFSDGLIRGINPIPGTNKLLIDSGGLLSIYDLDKNTIIPVISGGRERVSIGSVPSNSQNVTLYSEIDNKLSKDVINVDTGQVVSSEIVALRVYAYALIKDSAGGVSGEVTNDHINKRLTINVNGSRRTLEYEDWLNHLNIPNFMKDNLFFTSISVLNDTIWAAGGNPSSIDGLERSVVVSWPLNSNPSTNKNVLTAYIINSNNFSIARRMEWGIFGIDLPALLTRVENMGLVSIETKVDGSPADNKAVTYLAIKDQAAPLYKVWTPVLLSTSSP